MSDRVVTERFRYFSYDPEDGLQFHATSGEARARARHALECYQDEASEGWNESVTDVCWGRVCGRVHESRRMTWEEWMRSQGDDDPIPPFPFDEYVEYDLEEAGDE